MSFFQSTQVQWWLLGDDNKEMSDLRLLFLPISNYLYSCVHLFHTFPFKLKRQLFPTTIQVNKVWRTGEELCDMTGLGQTQNRLVCHLLFELSQSFKTGIFLLDLLESLKNVHGNSEPLEHSRLITWQILFSQ